MEPSSEEARPRGRFRITKLEDRIAPSLGGSLLSSVTSIVESMSDGGHACGCDDPDVSNSTSITDRHEEHNWSARSDGFSVGKHDGDGWTLFESRGGSIEHEHESSSTTIDREYRAG